MQTTMLCSVGVFSTATMCSPWRPAEAERGDGGGRVFAEPLREAFVGPRLARRPGRRCVARFEFRMSSTIASMARGLDVALLGEDRLERPHPHFDVGELTVAWVVGVAHRVDSFGLFDLHTDCRN